MDIYVSENAIEKFGVNSFTNDINYYSKLLGDRDFVELDNGIVISSDDDYNILIGANLYDEKYHSMSDILKKRDVIEKSQYFNMKKICEKSNVSYDQFKKWKGNGGFKGLSMQKVEKILEVMKEVGMNGDE